MSRAPARRNLKRRPQPSRRKAKQVGLLDRAIAALPLMVGVAVPPAPRPVQVMEESTKPAGGADSVIVVAVEGTVSTCVAPATPTPAVVVVMFCAANPLVPENAKLPTPPLLTFVTVTVGRRVLVYVQTTSPSAAAMVNPSAGLPSAAPVHASELE